MLNSGWPHTMTDAPPPLSPTSTLFPPASPGSANVSFANEKTDVSQDSQSDDDTQPTMAEDTLPTTRPQNTAKARCRKKFGIRHASVNPQRGQYVSRIRFITLSCATQEMTHLTTNRNTRRTKRSKKWDQWRASGRSFSTNVAGSTPRWLKTGGTLWTCS